ncbi:MAG: hypothetical protein HY216_05430 [Candidatus Rokubacteria bacterium]|nr:hypothetical protein [Candidatus Rokubacteria bacterium]
MSPGGHLVTTALACASSLAASHGAPVADTAALAAGIAVGGFLIDVDHALDYVLFERQRDLRPGAFLRYYLEGRVHRTVLVLHSYELFALLGVIAWWTGSLALAGYLLGALMHLALDLLFNGEQLPRSISAFYCFTYRVVHRFDAARLMGAHDPWRVPAGFWGGFFRGAERDGHPTRPTPVTRRRAPSAAEGT